MKLTRPLQLLVILAIGVLGAVTAGVVAQAGTTKTTKTTVNVTEREFAIKLSVRRVPVGVVHLVIKNSGKYSHALSVKEGALTKRTPLIKPGKTASLTVTLRKGNVSLWCPVPGHAARGMKATLAVGAAALPPPKTTTADTTTTVYDPPPVPGY